MIYYLHSISEEKVSLFDIFLVLYNINVGCATGKQLCFVMRQVMLSKINETLKSL